jgi:fructose 1,6-bisphosphate aldolase/phosphatase
MKVTLSVIKADIGSIGGHIQPSEDLLDAVASHVEEHGKGLVIDSYISFTGDDVAILTTHTRGCSDERIHELAWGAFRAGMQVAREQGLYAAGQDLLKDAFSGNVRGMGPAVAELELDERPGEPFLFFAADKTDPGAFNLPLYLAFADPMNTPGLMLSPEIARGFKFVIMDVGFTKGDRIIELETPNIYARSPPCSRDTGAMSSNRSARARRQQAIAVSTSRLHNIAGKYVGKDDR